MDFAEKLKTTRTSKNISVYKLSQMSGVSETHIRDLERGVRNPSFDTLNRLVEPMGISLSELFNDSDDLTFLNKEERELVDCFRLLPKDRADSLLNFIKTLV